MRGANLFYKNISENEGNVGAGQAASASLPDQSITTGLQEGRGDAGAGYFCSAYGCALRTGCACYSLSNAAYMDENIIAYLQILRPSHTCR